MTNNDRMILRTATVDDAAALLDIYAPYVTDTAISFELTVPSVADFRARIETTLRRWPYLVAERGGEVLGYAYTGPFKTRAAYDRCVETSIYVRRDARGTGVGKRLYAALEALSEAQGIQNMYACIAWAETENERLSNASARFHERLGYRLCGRFRRCAYKFDAWYDMIWMEKPLGTHEVPPPPLVPFPELSVEPLHAAGLEE